MYFLVCQREEEEANPAQQAIREQQQQQHTRGRAMKVRRSEGEKTVARPAIKLYTLSYAVTLRLELFSL